ncbi:insulin-like growth factor-binding protein-related protein 1 [Tachypleus tridentatus]|uniref:insulin-like growth factor-binding protein-related protein 1 n=1 Tax=Tachypleus tridentatus TaxID=6853 RepID=UPI003FD3E3B9
MKQMLVRTALLLTALTAVVSGAEKECGPCIPEACPPPTNCLAGMVKDRCGCCFVCGQLEGQLCDYKAASHPQKYKHGRCGDNMECRLRNDLPPGDHPEALCFCLEEEPLCGSDGQTYETNCHLNQARNKRRDDGLHAVSRGPCESAPKIVSPPRNVYNKTGSFVAFTCEVSGFPVPSIEWKVDRGDGILIPLPTDDSHIAVQSRGGPSHYEVTSWLQLLDINAKDSATYWCIAKNNMGEASESAQLYVQDKSGRQEYEEYPNAL